MNERHQTCIDYVVLDFPSAPLSSSPGEHLILKGATALVVIQALTNLNDGKKPLGFVSYAHCWVNRIWTEPLTDERA